MLNPCFSSMYEKIGFRLVLVYGEMIRIFQTLHSPRNPPLSQTRHPASEPRRIWMLTYLDLVCKA